MAIGDFGDDGTRINHTLLYECFDGQRPMSDCGVVDWFKESFPGRNTLHKDFAPECKSCIGNAIKKKAAEVTCVVNQKYATGQSYAVFKQGFRVTRPKISEKVDDKRLSQYKKWDADLRCGASKVIKGNVGSNNKFLDVAKAIGCWAEIRDKTHAKFDDWSLYYNCENMLWFEFSRVGGKGWKNVHDCFLATVGRMTFALLAGYSKANCRAEADGLVPYQCDAFVCIENPKLDANELKNRTVQVGPGPIPVA